MKSKKVLIPVIASLVTVLVLSGVSYAFYSAKIKENNKTETVIKSNELNLIFTGTNEITANNMIPGDSFTKTFTVENTSNRTVDFNIYLQNITNEFNDDLVYTLTDEDGVVVSEIALPVSSTEKTYLKTNIEIESGVTKNYTLKITFKNTDEPQNDYQGKTFKATVGIDTKNVEKEFNITGNIIDSKTGEVTEGKLVFYSERKDVKIKDNGEFSVEKLETGQHNVYYVGNIDVENMDKNEIISNSICHASFSVPKDKNIQFNCNDETEIQMKNLQYKKWEEKIICKRATTLHTETCSQTSTRFYCSVDGYAEGDTITYGNLGENGTLATGDAFDCDVNGDGIYDAETERFYYVSDMANGITTDSNTAILIYYNNVSGGEPSNSTKYAYYESTSDISYKGPVTAKLQLPTTTQWSNISLNSTTRQITNEKGGTTTCQTVSCENLPSSFSYEGYAARLLTYQEVYNGCYDGTKAIESIKGLSAKCKYLMENTMYSSESLPTWGYWLETPEYSSYSMAYRVAAHTSGIANGMVSSVISDLGVRPAIEISKTNIQY